MNINQAIVKSLKWSFLGKIVIAFFRLFVTALLARLLTPEDYGLFAIISVILNFLLMMRDFGFGAFILRSETVNYKLYDSVNTLNLVIGFFLTLIIFIFSPILGYLYNNSILTSLIKVLSICIIIQSVGQVSNVEVRKRLNFKLVSIIENVSFFLGSTLAITMAVLDYGVWSLVFSQIFTTLISTLLFLIKSKYKLKFKFEIIELKKAFNFSINVSIDKIVNFIRINFDKLISAKLLNIDVTGMYNMSQSLVNIPIKFISHTFKDVMLPSFSYLMSDERKLREYYLSIIQIVGIVVFPVLLVFATDSKEIISIILGDQWKDISSVLSILAIIGIVQSVLTISGTIFISFNCTDFPLRINSIFLPLYIIGFIVGAYFYGIQGLAISYLAIYILNCIPIAIKTMELMDIKFILVLKIFKILVLPLLIILTMKLIWINKSEFIMNSKIDFLIYIILSSVFYLISIFFQKKNILFNFDANE